MRGLGFVGVAVAFLGTAPAVALDHAMVVDGAGTELTLVSAHVNTEDHQRTLTLTVMPSQTLTDEEAQAASENLFERYVMSTVQRLGIGRAVILVGPPAPAPAPNAEAARTFRFVNVGGGDWSLRGRPGTSVEKPYLNPKTVKLDDGTRVYEERVETLKERAGNRLVTNLRAELLFQGMNPMMERGEIYLALAAYWQERLRARAIEARADAVEIVASFTPRSRRFQARDGLVLRISRGKESWLELPELPVDDSQLPRLAADNSRTETERTRFGPVDATAFNSIFGEILDGALAPAGLTAAH